MKNLLTKKNLWILSGIVFAVLIFSLWYQPVNPAPELVASSPVEGSKQASLTEGVLLEFDQELDLAELKISSVPSEEWTLKSRGDELSFVANPKQYLRVATDYILSISYKDKLIATLSFRTAPQQGDPRYTQQVLQEMDRDYPLAKYFPYTTANFRVVYSSPLTLEITIKNPNLGSDEIVSEVRNFVQQKGGNPTEHKYLIAK